MPDDATLEAAGARIGTIRILPREIFDTSLPAENTSLLRLANRLHIETRVATIEAQLLFRSGDRYDGRQRRENERLIRSVRYLYDAHITPVAWHDGVVDLEVVTRDVWTLNPGVSFGRQGGANSSGFEIEELNLLGLGSQLSAGYRSNVDRNSTVFLYRDRQIGSSWWGVSAKYSDNSDGRATELILDHPFYALDVHWAGGASFSDDRRVDSRYDLGEVVGEYGVHARYATAYGGWSAGLRNGYTQRWTAGVTSDEKAFSAVPFTTLPTTLPSDRKLVYPWVASEWIQDDFREARNRDQIERTEDVAMGWRARVQLGYASGTFGADRSAMLLDASASRGIEPTPRQSWLFSATATGRHEGGRFADAVVSGSARYYFRQSERRLLYAALGFDAGSRLDAEHVIQLGGDNGLRGYPLRYQGGTGRWLFTLEQRAFTNWFPFRLVNVGGAAFVDVGGTWGDNPFGSRSQGVLKDIGVGLRLGNSRSALGNVLHVDIAFPLDGGKSIDKLQFLVGTKRSY
jgi:hemolysin activation/secretion protein